MAQDGIIFNANADSSHRLKERGIPKLFVNEAHWIAFYRT